MAGLTSTKTDKWLVDGVPGAVVATDDGVVASPGAVVGYDCGEMRVVIGKADAGGLVRPLHDLSVARLRPPFLVQHADLGCVTTYDPFILWCWLTDRMIPYPFVLFGYDGVYGHLFWDEGRRYPCLRDDGIAALL